MRIAINKPKNTRLFSRITIKFYAPNSCNDDMLEELVKATDDLLINIEGTVSDYLDNDLIAVMED